MITSATVDNFLATRGETVTLRRPGSPDVDVCCLAKISDGTAVSTTGGTAQFDRTAILSNKAIADSGWPGPPVRGDRIVFRGGKVTTVQSCASVWIGSDPVKHALQLRGA